MERLINILKLLIFSFLLFGLKTNGQNVSAIRIGETNPCESAYVFGTGEQLSGQQFQTEGLITYNAYQYAVYYNVSRNVCIARRKMPVGSWQEVILPYKNSTDDAHNTISMGICANDGTIHLAYDHHNDDLHYCYSTLGLANDPDLPWEAASFSATTHIMDVAVPNVTYPRFISKPDGNLLFECRFRWSGYGDSYLREYNAATKQWTLIGRYVQGEDVTPDACAYINGMTYDYFNRLHVTWCWRDDFGGGSNHDFYYAYSEDHGRTWKDNNGNYVATTQLMQPVEDKTTGTSLSQTKKSQLMIEEISYNRGYINQETQAVDNEGRIHAVNSHIPNGGGTDSNWANSRLKARLHHRFRKADGTWVTRMIKNNGNTVQSYCRVNLSFDAFDNAYVVANGAEVYAATKANDYNDWDLLSNIDAGRFLSEPLVDRPLLKNEGVLSFVYLGADKKITVIDYLTKNPNTPNGTGLLAEYFEDENFETLISSETIALPQLSNIPTNTKSIRWSGTFETLLGERYSLYVNTNSKTNVYVNDKRVALTKAGTTSTECKFECQIIPSHKNNITIESASNQPLSLMWSSASTTKQDIPTTSLYPEKKNDKSVELEVPDLQNKNTLIETLSTSSQHINTTDKEIITLPFNPSGDYSLEVKAKINAADGRGLDIDARAKNGKGFRFSLDETSLKNTNPLSSSTRIAVVDNSMEQTYRFAVKNDRVHVYAGKEYLGATNINIVKDILADDSEVEAASSQGGNIIGTWFGSGLPTAYGWSASTSSVPWTNGGGGVRYETPTHNLDIGGSYSGTLLTIRWDANELNGATYFYPVALDANTSYEFSFLHEYWGSASTAQTLTVGISNSQNDNGIYSSQSFVTPATAQTLREGKFLFTSKEAGTYYLTFKGTWAMHAIGKLELKDNIYNSRLILGKNHNGGALNADIIYVSYEEGAFAPYAEAAVIQPELPQKHTLPTLVQDNISFENNMGTKNVHTLDFNPTGDYSVEISTTVETSEGRGLDLEVRDENLQGFRTSLNKSSFRWIAPFSNNLLITNTNGNKQVIRYAVEGNNAHIYKDGEFVKTFSLAEIGNMNASGTSEESVGEQKPADINNAANLITNPEFAADAHNAAPSGWTSDHQMGTSPNPRIQEKSQTTELGAYPDGKKAFMFRFDGNGGSYYSYAVSLEPELWYEFSFDLISWGTVTGAEFEVAVAKSADASSGKINSKTVTTPAIRASAERKSIRFRTEAASKAETYYLIFRKINDVGTTAITDLYLAHSVVNHLLFGKNYTQGQASILIDYITVDYSGAFAPEKNVSHNKEPQTSDNIRLFSEDNSLRLVSNGVMHYVSIFDVMGRIYFNNNIESTDLNISLPKGLYIIHINTDNGNVVKKMTVK